MDLLGPKGANAEAYWKAVVEAAGLGVWDYDTVTGQRQYSRRWREIRGLGPEDVITGSDEDWLATVHPDDRAVARHYTSLINEGRADEVAFEYRERAPDGSWIWIMCRGRAILHDETGRAVRFVGVDTDITAMKQTEEERALYSKQLEVAVTTSKIGVWQYHVTPARAIWDRRVREIYGLPVDLDPLPHDVWEKAIHPDDLQQVLDTTARRQKLGEDYDLEYRIIRPSGEVRHIRSRASYVVDGIDGPCFVGVDWDVTEDVQRAAQLQEAKQEAEERLYQLELAHKEMEYLSNHDPLTGLANRRKLRNYLSELCPDGKAPAGTGFLLFDVDRFKRVNDRFGHSMGDEMIECVARAIAERLDQAAIVARTGGDEFLAVLPQATCTDSLVTIGQSAIDAARLATRGRGEEMTVSVGIALAVHGVSVSDILTQADRAMYKAKLMGGAIAAVA